MCNHYSITTNQEAIRVMDLMPSDKRTQKRACCFAKIFGSFSMVSMELIRANLASLAGLLRMTFVHLPFPSGQKRPGAT